MQRLCHEPTRLALLAAALLCASATPVRGGEPPANDYPTHARVEFVNECIGRHGKLSNLYQCSCAIDRIANKLSYDDFVESSTFAKYASLPGEGGGIFRDSEEAKKKASLYRELEADAYKACGVEP